jgi:hypothetical protein
MKRPKKMPNQKKTISDQIASNQGKNFFAGDLP